MFEHLGPTPEVNIKKRVTNFKVYLSFLFAAVLVFVFSLGFSQGPKSGAYGSDISKLKAKVIADNSDKKIPYQTNNFSVFDFVINVEKEGVELDKLEVLVDGVYDLDFIDDLKVFHEGTQLGEVKEIDGQGRIYFDLEDYQLDKGQNLFRFIVPNKGVVSAGDVLELSIEDSWDIFLNYQGHLFTPSGEFPIKSGMVSFVDKGQISAINNYQGLDVLINSDIPQKLASFSLTTDSESIDIDGLTIKVEALDEETELAEATFALIKNMEPMAQANLDIDDNTIKFDFYQPAILKKGEKLSLDLHTFALEEGLYNFGLVDVDAMGTVSGAKVSLGKNLDIARAQVKSRFVEFRAYQQETLLSAGWNELYNFNIKPQGFDDISVYKLSWQVEKHGLEISEAELLVNGKTYIADFVADDDKIVVKSSIQNPITIDSAGADISLIVKVENLERSASLGAKLLYDQSEDSENLLLAIDGETFNSYNMPHFPLSPAILNN